MKVMQSLVLIIIGATIVLAVMKFPHIKTADASLSPKPTHFTVSSSRQGRNEAGGEVCIVTAENSYSSVTAIHLPPCRRDVGDDVYKYPGSDVLSPSGNTYEGHLMFITEEHKIK